VELGELVELRKLVEPSHSWRQIVVLGELVVLGEYVELEQHHSFRLVFELEVQFVGLE